MSTYTDLHNRVKETLNVDFHSRITPQRARFLNEENEYWGTFSGTLSADDIDVNGGTLTNVKVNHATLSDVTLKTSDGTSIDMNSLANDVQQISAVAYTEIPKIYGDIRYLSGQISSSDTKFEEFKAETNSKFDYVSAAISNEVADRISADTAIYETVDSVSCKLSTDYVARIATEKSERVAFDNQLDTKIDRRVDAEAAIRAAADTELSDSFLSALYHDKHYTLNPVDTTVYPYVTKEFAVNIITNKLADALVYDQVNGKQVGKIEGDVDSFTFTAFGNIDEEYKVGLVPGYGYDFKNGVTQLYTINGYQLVVEKGTTLTSTKITLKPTATEYYKLNWDKTAEERLMLGRITAAYATPANKVLSGFVTVNTTDSTMAAFNVQYAEFNSTTKTDISVTNSDVITYNGDNTFDFKKNIADYKYISLSNTLAEGAPIFGKVYEIDVDKEGETLKSVRVKLLDKVDKVELTQENGFKAEVSGDLSSTTYLSASDSLVFHERKEAIRYKYGFYDETDTSFTTPVGYIAITDLNTKMSDDFDCTLSADLTTIEKIPELKRKFELTRTPGTSKWTTGQTVEGNVITIEFDKEAKTFDYTIVTAVHHKVVQASFITNNTTVFVDEDFSEDIAKSQAVVLDFTGSPHELIPEKTFRVNVGEKVTEVGPTWVFDPKTAGMDVVKMVVPNKKADDISREEVIVTKFETGTLGGSVQVKFIDELGRDIRVYNEKSLTYRVPTNTYTTFKIQEVQPDIFLLVDLNENSQEGRLAKLREDLNNEISARKDDSEFLSAGLSGLSGQVEDLSAEVSGIITRDRKDLTYFGELNYVDDTVDKHLSCFLRNQSRWYGQDDYKFHYGFMYRLSAEQSHLIDSTGATNYLGVNDYIIFNKERTLSDVTFNDMVMIRDAAGEAAAMQKWVCDNFVTLSGGNEIRGTNTFTGVLSAKDAKVDYLSAAKADVVNLSGSYYDFTSGKIHDLEVTGKLTVHETETEADIDKLSANTAMITSAGISVEVVGKSTVTSAEVTNLTAIAAKVTNLTADSLNNIYIGDRGKTLQSIIDLSVDNISAQISATSCDLSNWLNNLQLSVGGVSAIVDALSTGLSGKIDSLELSVNGVSGLVDQLSGELNTTSGLLSNQITALWADVKGGVNYKGHLKSYRDAEEKTVDLSAIYLHSFSEYTPGTLLNNGWMYCFTTEEATKKYTTKDGIALEDRDYIIVHSHSDLSAVPVSAIGRSTIDIIDAADDDYVRIDLLAKVSADLSTDYTGKISNLTLSVNGISGVVNSLSAGLSGKIDSLELSVNGVSAVVNALSNGLSGKIDALELSTNGISNVVDAVSAGLSTKIDALELSTNGISGIVDALSAGLSGKIDALELSTNGISGVVGALSTGLSGKIDQLELSVAGISSRFDGLSDHLSFTLSGISREKDAVHDISSDNLIITDEQVSPGHVHNRYYMTFLSGTLVLNPIA